jgi:hypothetical protein
MPADAPISAGGLSLERVASVAMDLVGGCCTRPARGTRAIQSRAVAIVIERSAIVREGRVLFRGPTMRADDGDVGAAGAEVRGDEFLEFELLSDGDEEAEDVADDGEGGGLAGAGFAECDVATGGEREVEAGEVAAGDAEARDISVFDMRAR